MTNNAKQDTFLKELIKGSGYKSYIPENIEDVRDPNSRMWRLRVSIYPESENLYKAASIVSNLLFSFDKEIYFKCLVLNETSLLNIPWDGTNTNTLGWSSDRDKRCEEISIYIKYNSKSQKYQFTTLELETLILTIWQVLKEGGVNLGYIYPGAGENEILTSEGYPTPFAYSSKKHWQNRHSQLTEINHNPYDFPDPFENMNLNIEMLSSYSITKYDIFKMLIDRIKYMGSHYDAAVTNIKNYLLAVEQNFGKGLFESLTAMQDFIAEKFENNIDTFTNEDKFTLSNMIDMIDDICPRMPNSNITADDSWKEVKFYTTEILNGLENKIDERYNIPNWKCFIEKFHDSQKFFVNEIMMTINEYLNNNDVINLIQKEFIDFNIQKFESNNPYFLQIFYRKISHLAREERNLYFEQSRYEGFYKLELQSSIENHDHVTSKLLLDNPAIKTEEVDGIAENFSQVINDVLRFDKTKQEGGYSNLSKWQHLFTYKHSKEWQDKSAKIRDEALNNLMCQIDMLEGRPESQIAVLKYAMQEDLYADSNSNYFFSKAFGKPTSLKIIEDKIKQIEKKYNINQNTGT